MSPPSGFPYNYYCPCHRRHPHQLQGINTIGVIMVLTVIIFINVTILDQAVTTYKPHLSDIPVLPESSSPFWTRQWPHTRHAFHITPVLPESRSSGWWWPAWSSRPWWGRGSSGARAATTWGVPWSPAPPPSVPRLARTPRSCSNPARGGQKDRMLLTWT